MAGNRFDQRKTAQGYRSPGAREGCRNCRHRSVTAIVIKGESDNRVPFYDCTLGHFLVAAGGICDRYTPAGIATRPTPKDNNNEKL